MSLLLAIIGGIIVYYKKRGKAYFHFNILRRLIDKLSQGREIRATSKKLISIPRMKIEPGELLLNDDGTFTLKAFDLELEIELILNRDKRRKVK